MNTEQTIRAWKDLSFVNNLSNDERNQLAAHPSGPMLPFGIEEGEKDYTPDCSEGMSSFCGC